MRRANCSIRDGRAAADGEEDRVGWKESRHRRVEEKVLLFRPMPAIITAVVCAALQTDPAMIPQKDQIVVKRQNCDLVTPLSFVRISARALHRTRQI